MSIPKALLTCGVILALSQSHASGGGYELSRVTLNGGGGEVSSGQHALRFTLAQNVAGISRGESTALQVGFWAAADVGSIFEDGFEEAP